MENNNQNVMPAAIRKALERILCYLWDDERASYEGTPSQDRTHHIFEPLCDVSKWLNCQAVGGRASVTRSDRLSVPITFFQHLDNVLDDWAARCGQQPDDLRKAIIDAVRTRHRDARIDHPSHQAHDCFPDIYSLSLGSSTIYFAMDPQAVQICGFHWETGKESQDDFDGGAIFLPVLSRRFPAAVKDAMEPGQPAAIVRGEGWSL